MRADLHNLARDFHCRAVPPDSGFVNRLTESSQNGFQNTAPDMSNNLPNLLLGFSEIATLMQEFLGKPVTKK